MIKKYIRDLKKEFTGYNTRLFAGDCMAGLTVAAVALPLALAFGVSSGADAASGLITAIIAGLLIGSLSGASYQISGPTGAMAAILLGLSAQYGLKGVFFTGFLSGVLLLIAAALKCGSLVSYIPGPVITGFTSGIAIIIASGQIDNFLGTTGTISQEINVQSVVFGLLVMIIMILWPKKWNEKCPSSLVGIVAALLVNLVGDFHVAEVGAIPKTLILENRFRLADFHWEQIPMFISPAISIAALGMIESLLCGASAGNMKNEKIDAQRELVAQGMGNMVIPFLGGVPATAAIARTSVAIKSGGNTRLVSIIHAFVLIISMFLLGPVMSRIPMAALAGVLMVTAFRMNEWKVIREIFRKKFKTSMAQFGVTMLATIVFDLTIAIMLGVFVSILIFVVKSCELQAEVRAVDKKRLSGHQITADHSNTKILYLTGPLFFGTQDKLVQKIESLDQVKTLIFSMRGVPSVDASAIAELEKIVEKFELRQISVLFSGVQPNVKNMFDRAGFTQRMGEDRFYWDVIAAMESLE